MLLREAFAQGMKTLRAAGVPSPGLAAELLLMHTLGCDRGELHAHPDREVSPELAGRYSEYLTERLTGKPTQYITGHQEFWGLDFEVSPAVLIPRPETELLVETVAELASAGASGAAPCRIVDAGTGSGCIALALASELPHATIDAVDISEEALDVARRNATRLRLDARVRFRAGDWLEPFLREDGKASFHFVVSNPPYVGRAELDGVQREVREFEPRLAWGGQDEPEQVYRRLFSEAMALLKPGGYVVVEIGYSQSGAVTRLLRETWCEISVRPDLAGIPRAVIARKRFT
jgi:release factor glutamine methyltransferase